MSDAIDDFFAAAENAPGADPAPTLQHRALRAMMLLEQHHALHMDVLASLAGIALLMSMVAPDRQRLGTLRLAERPVVSFLVGFAVLAVVAVGFRALIVLGIVPGRPLLGAVAFFAVATGLATSARSLGARVLPDRTGLAQTVVGLVALILPLAWPIGVLTTVIAAPLGLGGWMTCALMKRSEALGKAA